MELSKKVAYLKGLMEGLKIDDSTNEGKILTIMADILDEMSVDALLALESGSVTVPFTFELLLLLCVVPLRVEYRLTDAGKKLIPAIDFLYTWSIHRMQELNVPIDPDAFVVLTSSRYDASLKHIIEHYDELCDFFEYADEHQLDIHAALEKLRHS